MNWGQKISLAMALLSFAASIGYAYAGDWKRSLYFFFGCCITLTVIWK